MHPNPLFRTDDRALMELLIEEIGFGMVFAQTPDGPRVAHTPLISTGDGAVQFHLARGNALSRHLDGATALVVVNGPDAYISPRWYANRDTVPTWDYVALELEGRVRRMADEGLEAFLHAAILRHEGRLGGEPWVAEESPRKSGAGCSAGSSASSSRCRPGALLSSCRRRRRPRNAPRSPRGWRPPATPRSPT